MFTMYNRHKTWLGTTSMILYLRVYWNSKLLILAGISTDLRDLRKFSHENHDDWTQLQVVRACSGYSCVPVQARAVHSFLSSLSYLLPPFVPFSVDESPHKVRLCCVQACVFLDRCIHAFSSFFPLPSHIRVSLFPSPPSPPRSKKIKPHLTRWLSLSHTIRRVMRREFMK